MAHGVTVAQAPLERFVKVRILVGQLEQQHHSALPRTTLHFPTETEEVA